MCSTFVKSPFIRYGQQLAHNNTPDAVVILMQISSPSHYTSSSLAASRRYLLPKVSIPTKTLQITTENYGIEAKCDEMRAIRFAQIAADINFDIFRTNHAQTERVSIGLIR